MTQGDLLLPDSIETALLGARQHFFSTQLLIYIRHLCKVRHIGLEHHRSSSCKGICYTTQCLWNALIHCSKVYITTNKLLLVTSILFWEYRDLKLLFHCCPMTSLQLCLPYWGIYYIDRSLSHTIGTGRCWLSLGALSKLFLKAAWAVLTHSPSISTYAKEKTTAISSTRSSGAQVFALFSQ